MIVDSRALSISQAIALANNQPIQLNSSEEMQPHDRIALVSIRDSSMPKVFEDSDTVCVVEFADIEPMDTSFIPPEDSEYMKSEHAKKILDFITKWRDKKEKVVLFAHCQHGMCRSGAVVDFVGLVCGLGFWNTRRRNPQIVPNHWVQYKLMEEFFARKSKQTLP